MRIEYCSDTFKNIENGIILTPSAFKIGESAILGALYEVSTSPSPGLVSPYSSGSHNDMDFFTFLRSTSSISYAMYLCAQIGIDNDDEILKKVRSIGVYAEKNMLDSTGGINTQRGLLFLAGIVCAAAGSCIRKNKDINRFNISEECSIICNGIVDRELKSLDKNDKLTNGEKLYLEYGIAGIRSEIENGLPSVLNTSLPLFEEALEFGMELKNALCHSLIGLMTVVEDTTVISRCGLNGLEMMRNEAKIALELGGMKSSGGIRHINYMEKVFRSKKISPGGAADLLAITVMIYELEKAGGRNKKETYLKQL
ncbi:MAG: triphosphoribosyl-dephospho-CoA synthase [Clostridiaceae bacterium]|nr:triphosphoribosyl-dephospho-CoA synthase [Clostridiaceae bacterium]